MTLKLQEQVKTAKLEAKTNLDDFRCDCECRVAQAREAQLAAEHMCQILTHQLKAAGVKEAASVVRPGSPSSVAAAKAVAKGGWDAGEYPPRSLP